MIHRSGSIILATDEKNGEFLGMLIRESANDNYKVGEYRKDWVDFVDFFGTVELKSEWAKTVSFLIFSKLVINGKSAIRSGQSTTQQIIMCGWLFPFAMDRITMLDIGHR